MAESATRKASARGAVPAKENFLPPLRIRYYKKMKRHRVYPFVIGWKVAERGVAGKDVTLRLLVSGAQVVPAEQNLKPTDPEDEVTFHVTPLAEGRLGGSRLEVLYQDRKVQEVPLVCRVTNQAPTRFLLAMALVVPALLLYFCKYNPIQEGLLTPGQTLEKWLTDNAPGLPRVVKDNLPDAESWFAGLRTGLAEFYDGLWTHSQQEPIAFYVAAVFLVLAMLSALMRADRRKRRLGKPIPIPALPAPVRQEED